MILWTFCLLSVLVPAAAADERTKKDLAALQGTWKVHAAEVDGESALYPEVSVRLVVKGGKVFYGGEELAGLTVDATANPRTIDLEYRKPKKVVEGIYALDGDTLKLCVNRQADGVKERPTDFTSKGKPNVRVLVFKRVKDEKDPTAGLPGFVGIMIRFDEARGEVVIQDPLEGSPAQKAGLKKDDVLLKINADAATDLQTTVRTIRQAKPGTELTLRIRRGEKEQDVKVKAGVLPFFLLD